ncbi:MAG: ExbD/TolR family protein [Janthinobacterium lividum]
MAALESAAPRKPSKKPRAAKRNFHLDMTPMVDLAFLLLTFFMLTTTFAKPRVQPLQMPVPDAMHPAPVPASQAMTILLGQGRQVAYYFGLNDPRGPLPALHRTNFSARGLRQALLARQRQGPLVVLIKADKLAHYQSLVDVLDEMNITSQPKYALTALTPADQLLLAARR